METFSVDLLRKIPLEQIKEVLNQDECDIDYDFLGFIKTYKNLSEIIPENFTIIDLGCGYNPQCFYFENHKKCIAVDFLKCKKFKSHNV